MCVARDAYDALDSAFPQRLEEAPPSEVRLGVDGVQADEAAVSVIAARDRRDERGRAHVPVVAAFEVRRIEPEVREPELAKGARLQVLHDRVERLADPRDLAGAHAVDPHRRCHLLDLARAHAVHDHLGDGGDHGPVDAGVAHEQVLGEVASHPQLRYPQRYRPHARDQGPFPVSVALVALGARLVGLRAHDLVDERLGHQPYQLLQVDHPVVESRNLGHDGAHLL